GLGLDLLYEWVVASRENVTATDYSIVLIVVVVTAGFGFVWGVMVGVLAAIGLFIVQYSKIDVVQAALSGDSYRSNVDRPLTDTDRLAETGNAIAIFRIHGFVFFGTANRLVGELRDRIAPEVVRYLVVDGSRVTGFDGSALHTFERFLEVAADEGVTTVLTGFGPLGAKVAAAEAAETVYRFDALDEGLEWAEDQILSNEDSLFSPVETQLVELAGPWVDDVRNLMDRVEFGSGETIIAEGSVGHPLFVIEYGRVRVVLASSGTRIRTMRPGAIIGEMAYYTRQPANASVIAETEVVAYALSATKLDNLLATNPRLAAEIHRRMARALSRRVTETNTALRKAMD
ncbi:MAG: cyclic nucleotide-binding domain-containing protein, partial [Acidimicrobiia bacterium]|nr:cyclic nucleotide-binding domain-containing protein [Acidimicrobiia bacterium]